jgi:hypothetical protein
MMRSFANHEETPVSRHIPSGRELSYENTASTTFRTALRPMRPCENRAQIANAQPIC